MPRKAVAKTATKQEIFYAYQDLLQELGAVAEAVTGVKMERAQETIKKVERDLKDKVQVVAGSLEAAVARAGNSDETYRDEG